MNHSTPGLPVHHHLPEFTQTQVHRVSDAIQPSHPLSSPSSPAPNPSQHQSLPMSQPFSWGGQSTGVSALASFLPKKVVKCHKKEKVGWEVHSSDGNMSFMKRHKESPFQRHDIWWNSLRNRGVIHTYVWDNEFQMEYSEWLLKRGGAREGKRKRITQVFG